MPNRPSAFYTIRILDSLLRFVPPLPPFSLKGSEIIAKKSKKNLWFLPLAVITQSEMGVLKPVHVLILGEGDRGPDLSAGLPRPLV